MQFLETIASVAVLFPCDGMYNTRSVKKRRKRRILYAIDDRCRYCLRQMTFEESTLDHIVPLKEYGSNGWDNLTLCCPECNQLKDCDVWDPKFRP